MNTQPAYGSYRLVIETGHNQPPNHVALAHDTDQTAKLRQVASGLPPWSFVALQQRRSFDWATLSSVSTLPAPGWAVPGAVHCKTCGVVGEDRCGHSNPSKPHGQL